MVFVSTALGQSAPDVRRTPTLATGAAHYAINETKSAPKHMISSPT